MAQRLFIAANQVEAFEATSPNEIGRSIGTTGNVLRTALSRSSGQPIVRNGYTVYVSQLDKIKGRGRIGK